MGKSRNITVIFLLFFGLLTSVTQAKSPGVLMCDGLYAEEIEGDLDAAIKIYEQIITDSSAQRSHVAEAMYRQGTCYLKKEDEARAKAVFEKLVAGYGDQVEIINKVKPLLEELSSADPAALMPPDTLIYLELGNPGRQIETILNMLKGTPFENPLAAIGGGHSHQTGDKTPADIMAALLNPSMIAEFKKIRGIAVGVTGIRENNPPMVLVLYPGKSDALRAVIFAALGMIAQQSEPIEGMSTLMIQDEGGVAYDDTVIIISFPPDRLEWCVKQYKNTNGEPTLASHNKCFAEIRRKSRQENALTLWANIDQVYAGLTKLFPEDEIPEEIRIADGFADFKNIDDLTSVVSIEESEIAVETNIEFKDGHNCLVYDMIRTPNLSRAGFEAVPSETVGLVSFALNKAEGSQSKAAIEKINNLTGLDIGREIFANIEQVTLFAVPSSSDSNQAAQGTPPIANCLGLAITSHNPSKTRQVLTRLLTTANLMAEGPVGGQPEQNVGKYQIGLIYGQKIHCYIDQSNKTTILSLAPSIVEKSSSAIKGKKSVCIAGPLSKSVNKLSPTTSKLALINLGGAIRLAAENINLGAIGDEGKLQEIFAQLANACDETFVQYRTNEELNNFNERISISGIPPANNIFGPLMQLNQILQEVKAKAREQKRKAEAPVNIRMTVQPPVIDGNEEDLWSGASKNKIGNVIYSPISSEGDFAAYFKAVWDNENLYMLVDVTDDKLENYTSQWYMDDCIEVFIDADNSKSEKFGANDYQYHFDWDRDKPVMDEDEHGKTDGVEFAMVTTEKGYRTEIKFPWSTLGTKPSAGVTIGLEVHANDDDAGRRTKLAWRGKKDVASSNPQTWGNARLAGLIGWWKFDEQEGKVAHDSSKNGHDGNLEGGAVFNADGGKIGGAVELDGDGDFVRIPNEQAFDISDEITMSCWVKFHTVSSEWTAILAKGDNAYRLSTAGPDNKNNFHMGIGITRDGMTHSGTSRFETDKWHHVVGVYDGREMRLYVDGVLDSAKSYEGKVNLNDYEIFIGENSQSTGRCFDGLIDDVRIYDFALSENEVRVLYDEGNKE